MKRIIMSVVASVTIMGCAQEVPCITSYETDKFGQMVINDCQSSTSFHTYSVVRDEDKSKPTVKVKESTPKTEEEEERKTSKVKRDNSDANGKGGNKHNREDHTKGGTEVAERKKG